MSVKVDLDQLTEALADYTFAYLVTVGDDYHAHTVAVEPQLGDGVIDVGPVGGSTRRNLTAHGNVTLVWPPSRRGGYTLIVDGHGQPADADAPLHIARSYTGRRHRTPRHGLPAARTIADLSKSVERHEKARLSALLG